MTSKGLGEMFEGVDGGRAEGHACADQGAEKEFVSLCHL